MKTTRTFEMNGKTYTSMMSIAKELGVKRIYPKDFDKYGIVETTDTTETQEVKNDVVETSEPVSETVEESNTNMDETSKETSEETIDAGSEEQNNKPQAEDDKNTNDGVKVVKAQKRVRKVGTAEEIQSVKDSIGSMTIQEFCEEVKHFTVPALLELVKSADATMNTWDSITNEPIRKMRLTMELKKFYFPNDKMASTKPATGWKKMELSKMMEIADDNHVDYKKYDDEKIQRMWLTVALNKAGLNPQDYLDTKDNQEVANG